MHKNNYSVRWNGNLDFTQAGKYIFDVTSDDGVMVWVDDNLIVDEWGDGLSQSQPMVTLTQGIHNVKVEYYQSSGTSRISLQITQVVNTRPTITSTAITQVDEGSQYSYTVTATDVEEDTLTYSLTQAPSTMQVNAQTGEITWAPTQADVGSQPITIQVSDGELSDTQNYVLTVTGLVHISNSLYLIDGANGITVGTLSNTEGTGALYDEIASAGGANYDGNVHSPLIYEINNLNGTYIADGETQFKLYLDALNSMANGTQLKVSYDFNGDDVFDLTDIYNYFPTNDATDWEEYNQSRGIESHNGTFADMQNGKVKIEVWNAIGNNIQELRTSANSGEGSQSAITIPFDLISII